MAVRSKSTASYTPKEKIFLQAIEEGRVEAVREILRDYPGFDPSFRDNEALRLAASLGRDQVIKVLLGCEKVDPGAREDEAIRMAAAKGYRAVVDVLLDGGRVNPGARNSEALRMAIAEDEYYQREYIVKRLLNHHLVNPAANDNEVVIRAARLDYQGILRLLLASPAVDAGARNNEALLTSVRCNNYGAFSLLLGNDKVNPAIGNYEVVRLIVTQRRAKFLKLLLGHPRVNSNAAAYIAMHTAMRHFIYSIADTLILHRKVGERRVVRMALEAGNEAMVGYLVGHKQVDLGECWEMAEELGKQELLRRCLEEAEARQQHGGRVIIPMISSPDQLRSSSPLERPTSCPPSPRPVGSPTGTKQKAVPTPIDPIRLMHQAFSIFKACHAHLPLEQQKEAISAMIKTVTGLDGVPPPISAVPLDDKGKDIVKDGTEGSPVSHGRLLELPRFSDLFGDRKRMAPEPVDGHEMKMLSILMDAAEARLQRHR